MRKAAGAPDYFGILETLSFGGLDSGRLFIMGSWTPYFLKF